MSPLNRRAFLRGSLAATGALGLPGALAACSSSSGGSGGKTTVKHWDYYVSQAGWIKNEVKLFDQAHPTLTVKRTEQSTTSYDNVFTLAERSGNAPDTFFITTNSVPLNEQVEKGWLLPLNEYATAEWVRRFPPYSFVEGSNMFDGKIYTAPFTSPSPLFQLYINNKVFRAAGLTNPDGSVKVPKTWDDMTRAADAIVRSSHGKTYGFGFGGSGGVLPWWLNVLVPAAGSPGAAGGQDLRTGRYSYSSDRNYQDLIDLILDWKKKDYFYPSSMSIADEIARAYFEQGKFGMTIGGVWNQTEWSQHKFTDYSLTTLVGPEETRKGYWYVQPGGTLMGVNAHTKHPDAAWEWFDQWHSPAAGRRWVQDYQEDLSVFPADNVASKIEFKPFAEYVALSKLAIGGPQPYIRNPAVAKVVVNPVQPDIGAVMSGLYTGQLKDTHSALASLDGRSQKALQAGIDAAVKAGHKVSLDDYKFPDWDITKPYKWDIPEYPK